MVYQICEDTKKKMTECLKRIEKKLRKMQVYRISVEMFGDILIKYYNEFVPLNRLAHLIMENSHTLIISVFEKKMISIIEKAILDTKLEVNISVIEKKKIRISILPLTEEHRKKIIKLLRAEVENGKILIRNIRRESNEKIKFFLKKNIISQDEDRILQKNIQNITDVYVKNINNLLENKEREVKTI